MAVGLIDDESSMIGTIHAVVLDVRQVCGALVLAQTVRRTAIV
jgi:hypothetical protein